MTWNIYIDLVIEKTKERYNDDYKEFNICWCNFYVSAGLAKKEPYYLELDTLIARQKRDNKGYLFPYSFKEREPSMLENRISFLKSLKEAT